MTSIEKKVNYRLICILIFTAGIAYAFSNIFIQDDAFISFIYSDNLTHGNGLTWFGEKVEGYTNFFWVLLMAVGIQLKISPVFFSLIWSLISYCLLVLLLFRSARQWVDDEKFSLFLSVLFMTNYTVSSYATGGLETMFQTLLIFVLFYLVQKANLSNRILGSITFLTLISLLVRLDSAILLAPIWIALFIRFLKEKKKTIFFFLSIAGVVLPIILWLLWKLYFYGNVLPNTFYAKDHGGTLYGIGLKYLPRFLKSYNLWIFLLITLIFIKEYLKKIRMSFLLAVALTLCWFGYLIYTGGDFMEYRLIVPIAPYLFLLIASNIWLLAHRLIKSPWFLIAPMGLFLIFSSLYHMKNFKAISPDKAIDSIPVLSTCYGLYPDHHWGKIGLKIKEYLSDDNITLAMTPVGAIPYYSQIKTIDMWGLNDKYIAHHGKLMPPDYKRPGHRRRADLDYLLERKVNLVFAHPKLIRRGYLNQITKNDVENFMYNCLGYESPYSRNLTATLVEIPLNSEISIIAWYLCGNKEIDSLIENRIWQSCEFNFVNEKG